jgi:adenine-specific DNA-methyltransferase
MLIVLQKNKLNDNYIFRARNGCFYISPHYNDLYHITENTTTLSELGLGVKTGNVIWNEVRENLADEGTLLIYSSNLTQCQLTLNNLCGSRKQYVTNINKPVLTGPVILVERGYGNTFKFNFALVDLPEFYAENHINVIYPKTPESVVHLEKVVKSFQNEKNKLFIEWFLGNGSVSATDLETIFPIF